MKKQKQELTAKIQKSSYFRNVIKRFFHHRLAVVGLTVITIEILLVIFLPLLFDLDPYRIDVMAFGDKPSAKHLIGTDEVGRDMLARLIYG